MVPDRQPRTKPKALNYALQFATGDLAVIYDAEDRPEPDQLRKAATQFHRASAGRGLPASPSRLFQRQRELALAPVHHRIRHAVPGASCRCSAGSACPCRWEAPRTTSASACCASLAPGTPIMSPRTPISACACTGPVIAPETLDFTTYEEACCKSVPWVKQRTRWLKGWMQTFGVHMRAPLVHLT